ncbi:MAG: acyl-CoA thioesterase, partial [Bacteroidota bacterium]|nr:acyl-CoA thioesterase [Bacteroidota bacterium]
MDKKIIEPKPIYTTRLVKSEDLNHHGTLFAGRTAEWFVECGFISAAELVGAEQIVCLKIHGMYFTR